LARDQPVKRHPDTGEVLLNRGSRALALQLLDIGDHMQRLDAPQLANPLPFAPAQEGRRRPPVSGPRVAVADIDGEELDKAQRGPFARPGDVGRFYKAKVPGVARLSNLFGKPRQGRRPLHAAKRRGAS
jgi:hypothetical protein